MKKLFLFLLTGLFIGTLAAQETNGEAKKDSNEEAANLKNAGNAAYNYSLTIQRVLDIFDWFERNGAATDFLIPYAAGSHEPLVPNNSTENRYRNRRLEVYLIPGEAMFK